MSTITRLASNAHVDAERMLADGRPLQAIFVLEERLKIKPDDTALRTHLEHVKTKYATQPAANLRVQIAWWFVLAHMLVPWMLLLAAFGVCFLVPFGFAEFLGLVDEQPIGYLSGSTMLLVFGTGTVLMVAIALIAWRMFLLFWFSYLRLLPARHALEADRCIESVMQVSIFGSAYFRLRGDLFEELYGA